MKWLFLILSFNVLAFPELGDFTRHEAYYDGKVLAYEQKLIEYNESDDSFILRELVYYDDQLVGRRVLKQPRSFLYSQQKIENLFTNCLQRGGMISFVEVKGETVKACEFYHEGSQLTYLIGMVPFGRVRFQEYVGDGQFLDFNMVDFHTN